MLTPEEARDRLAAVTIERDENETRKDLQRGWAAQLPKRLRERAFVLLDRAPDGSSIDDDNREATRKTRKSLAKLKPAELDKILTALCGAAGNPCADGLRWEAARGLSGRGPYCADGPAGGAGSLDLSAGNPWLLNAALKLGRHIDHAASDVRWLAAWASHVSVLDERPNWRRGGLDAAALWPVFAAAIDAGGPDGDAVFTTLAETLVGGHEVAAYDRHVIPALLACSRPEAWELVEKTLLAAQRQEGLRDEIVGGLGLAHLDAMKRLLRTIRDEKLTRFTSVWAALAGLFGFTSVDRAGMVVGMTAGQIAKCLDKLIALLESPDSLAGAADEADPETLWFRLWASDTAAKDRMLEIATSRAGDDDPAIRFVSLQFLRFIGAQVGPLAAEKIDDPHPQVADAAFWIVANRDAWRPDSSTGDPSSDDDDQRDASGETAARQRARFHALGRYLDALPKEGRELEPLVWPWTASTVRPEHVASQLGTWIGRIPPATLAPYFGRLGYHLRSVFDRLKKLDEWDPITAAAVREVAAGRKPDEAVMAVDLIGHHGPDADDVALLEGLLTRTSENLRGAVYRAVSALPGDGPLESAGRLLASGKAAQRYAGLELLRQFADADKFGGRPRELAADYAASKAGKKVPAKERLQLDALLAVDDPADSLEAGFGLLDRANLTRPVACERHDVVLATTAASRLISALDDFIGAHAKETYTDEYGQVQMLGEVRYGFGWRHDAETWKERKASMPLADLWLKWDENRPDALRDDDGLELLRAIAFLSSMPAAAYESGASQNGDDYYGHHVFGKGWLEAIGARAAKLLTGKVKWRRPRHGTGHVASSLVLSVLEFLVLPKRKAAWFDFELRAWETLCASVDVTAYEAWRKKRIAKEQVPPPWHVGEPVAFWQRRVVAGLDALTERKTRSAMKAFWPKLLWTETTAPESPYPQASAAVAEIAPRAYAAGAATLDDLTEIALRTEELALGGAMWRQPNGLLVELTDPRNELVASDDAVRERFEAVTSRIVEIELARGDAESETTALVRMVRSVAGIDPLRRLIGGLDKKGYARTTYYSETKSRRETLTALVRVTRPAEGDTPEAFAKSFKKAVKAGEFPEDRVLELAFLAPQWTAHVEAYFNWPGFAEGVYWLMAHMRGWGMGDRTEVAAEAAGYEAEAVEDGADWRTRGRAKSAWDRLIGERTPISKEDRDAGAIDVAWHAAVAKRLKPARWERLAAAARFADNAQQAKRAKFVGEVLAGRVEKAKLVADIRDRQLKDSVRLLGLLPLANGSKRQADVNDRYEVLAGYEKYARGLSGLSRPDAERAVGIGLDNLARSAGFADPLRMRWALEGESTSDLLDGPAEVRDGDAVFTLELDDRARPVTSQRRGDKTLKSLPKELKKHPEVVALKEKAKWLKSLNTRSRRSLEEAMVRGDEFTGKELKTLARHAVVWPMLSRLVLLGQGIAGYPDRAGRALRAADGRLEPVKASERLRIAHPHDLLERGDWSEWQRECLRAERVQPFKQVFRELYPLTAAEMKGGGTTQGRRADDHASRRYAGQQVQPSQALALFGSRGWSTEDGVWKTDHEEKITAEVHGRTLFRLGRPIRAADAGGGRLPAGRGVGPAAAARGPAAAVQRDDARRRPRRQRRPRGRRRPRGDRLDRRDAGLPARRDLPVARARQRRGRRRRVAGDDRGTLRDLHRPPRLGDGPPAAGRVGLPRTGPRPTPRPPVPPVRRRRPADGRGAEQGPAPRRR